MSRRCSMLARAGLVCWLAAGCGSSSHGAVLDAGHGDAGQRDVGAQPPVPHCMFGADQSCNDNPALNSLHGTCNQDGTCTCHAPFGKSPTTGRCL
jgi:hypothetical protein